MAREATKASWRVRFVVPFAAGLTMLGFTLVNLLNYNSYPLLRPELGYLSGGLVLLCAAMAALYSGQRRWGRAFLEAVLVAVVVDLNLESLWMTAAAFVASFAFVIVKRKSLVPFAAVMGSVMLVLSLAGFGQEHELIETSAETTPARSIVGHSSGPAILHLIFDEQTGFEGFPNQSAVADKMKADLREFYGSRGFAMFGRAYSEHTQTANSIPQILNLGGPAPHQENPKRFSSVGRTRYIDGLRRRGYALHVYQTQYLDLCKSAAPVRCTTYDVSIISSLLHTPLSGYERAEILFFNFLTLSDVLRALDRKIPLLKFQYPVEAPLLPLSFTSPISSLLAMDRLAQDLRKAKPGEVYLAHVLLPHFPWALDENCQVLPLRHWDRRVVRFVGYQREVAYFRQMRCQLKKTDKLLRSLSQSPAGTNSIVIIQGDHGSRLWRNIPDKRFYSKSSDADYVAAFSTLFAVRSPQIGTTYVEEPASVGDLLRQLTESEFRALPKPTPGPPMVYLADENWRPWKRVQMPKSWWQDASDAHP